MVMITDLALAVSHKVLRVYYRLVLSPGSVLIRRTFRISEGTVVGIICIPARLIHL